MEAGSQEVNLEVRLALVPGVGPKTRRALRERFGSAAAIFTAGWAELRAVEGVGDVLAQRILSAARAEHERSVLATCHQHGIQWMLDDQPQYPRLLREISSPPSLLFYRGEFRPEDQRAVAIVGTRHASAYGLRQADRLARQLVQAGFTIVSGLARGIDAAAHRAALAAGGRTLAVLGGGLLEVYPREHRQLAEEIGRQGAVLSELPPHQPPQSGNFPQRNRIISGLALGVVVVEAGERSGALITARHASDQGREVFAVPGSVESPTSRGCHRLIRDGAKLVESSHDILEELGSLLELLADQPGPSAPLPMAAQKTPSPSNAIPQGLSEAERRCWLAICPEGSLIDDVIAASGLAPQEALVALTQLELKRHIRRLGGGAVARALSERRPP